MPPGWRLLRDGAAAGDWNMAVDEALLESASRVGVPTLRLYRWTGSWLSLGYGQRAAPELLAACEAAGVGVVRRVTGGRGVLHGGDLTYAIVAPEAALPPGLQASYALVSDALRAALDRLGVEAEPGIAAALAPGSSRQSFDCFAEAARDELCVGGRKLTGSAQRRAGGGVLQHGSLRVEPDPDAARRAAGLDPRSATCLAELGCRASTDDLERALVAAFGAQLGVGFALGELTSDENNRAGELARDRVIPNTTPSHTTPPESQERCPSADR